MKNSSVLNTKFTKRAGKAISAAKRLAPVFFLLLSVGFVSAQRVIAPVGEQIPFLRSTALASGEGSVSRQDNPDFTILNPAASGALQRTVVSLSYTGLTGFGRSGQGWDGHAGSIMASQPSRYGVFTGGFGLISTGLQDFDVGSGLMLSFGYSRDVWDDLLVGAGVTTDFGGRGGDLAFGAGLDIGFIHKPATLFGYEGAQWGASIRRIGYPYRPVEGLSGLPASFTPQIGLMLPLIDGEALSVELYTDLSTPGFRDARLSVAADMHLFDRIVLSSGLGLSVRELFDDTLPSQSLVPSFAISGRFTAGLPGSSDQTNTLVSQRGWDRNEFSVHSAARPLYGSVWGVSGGVTASLGVADDTPPLIHVQYRGRQYISPNNSGVQDDIVVPVDIVDEDRFLFGYRFVVQNEQGDTVREFSARTPLPAERTVSTFFERLGRIDTGITVPESFRWNGRSDAGTVVPDGVYRFFVEAWDDNDNTARSETFDVVVDLTAPEAELSTPFGAERVFSPDGDGIRDRFPVRQDGSSEDLWMGEIRSADGQVVRTFEWTDGPPESFEWDGTDNDGVRLEDGVYSYRLYATDRAGNEFTANLSNIIIDTEDTPVALTIDRAYLAPTGNGVNEQLGIGMDVPVRRNIQSWEMVVRNAAGNAVFRLGGGVDGPPQDYDFRGRASDGTLLPDGSYTAELQVRYRVSRVERAESPSFVVDTTPPRASVLTETDVFAPTGDGNRDGMILYHEADAADSWIGRVRNEAGDVVHELRWNRVPPARYVWDGRTTAGPLADDGDYTYELEGVDAAGNRSDLETVTFALTTEDVDVLLTVDLDAFSPNSNGVRDTVTLFPQIRATQDVRSYRLDIRNEAGDAVRTFQGDARVPPQVVWDGIDREGRRIPDGRYRANLEVLFETDVSAVAETADFIADTRAPEVNLSVNHRLFSPDGQDGRPAVRFTQSGSEESLWQGRVTDASDRTVRSYEWSGRPRNFQWDGRDDVGNLVPDGLYRYELTATDAAGNALEASIDNIRVDTRTARLFLTIDAPGIAPNGNGLFEDIGFSLIASLTQGLSDWELRVESVDSARVVRRFEGDELEREQELRWDGRDDSGTVVADGRYRAVFTARYEKGNRPSVQSTAFDVVANPPDVDVVLDPIPFAPDGSSDRDELEIQISVDSPVAIDEWVFEILDRNRRFFNEFFGTGTPAETILWDGRAIDGEQVISAEDYPYVLTVVDIYGNETVVEGIIPIDILVVVDGDALKVQIPSITFLPNSSSLVVDNEDPRGRQNSLVLDRLVEIFDRYPQYRITVEGHAVNPSGTEREEVEFLAPLSLQRAQSVRQALIERGMAAGRIDTVGRGGRDPLVPHDDLDERWKNRRVEFILER